MRIERFLATNFRNLAGQEIHFSPGVNLLIGDNGQGKTNLLEAVHFFKFGRSFRTHRDAEIIRFGEPFCRAEVMCVYDGDGGEAETFAVSIERDGTKRIKLSGGDVPRIADLVGRYPCILFGPHDLELVSGAPGERRRFIDMVGSMTNPAFIRVAREYKRVLQQRNAALKARAGAEELDAWNRQLVTAGVELTVRRCDLVAALEKEVRMHAGDLGAGIDVGARYDSELLWEGGESPDALEGVFTERLAAVVHDERRRFTTLVGPHRDDVALDLGGTDLRRYGSQGQQRLFAILLKLAELSHTERELGETCVLLLDDVFSEFDEGAMQRLQRLLDGKRQVFVTSPVELEWAELGVARVFSVKKGDVAAR